MLQRLLRWIVVFGAAQLAMVGCATTTPKPEESATQKEEAAGPTAPPKPEESPTQKENAAGPTASATTTSTPGPCAPLGNPVPGYPGLPGRNSFYLCAAPDPIEAPNQGRSEGYYITCNESSLRHGWKWRVYCKVGGTHCNCSLSEFRINRSCVWDLGQHCTANGQASPGAGACEKWGTE
jgi:hypothetical protein